MSICCARLPRAGLGNKLFVWARAAVFAEINHLPLFVSGFNKIRVGPILRREMGRFYLGQFQNLNTATRIDLLRAKLAYDVIREPSITSIDNSENRLFVFDRIPHWKDYFADLRDHRDFIRGELRRIVAPEILDDVGESAAPLVSIHVRHGDFRGLESGEDFSRVGLVRTPMEYFIKAIRDIREMSGKELPITVFSDGRDEDLGGLLNLPNVKRHPPGPAIADLLLMSRSRVLLPSAGSTFGYWAGFLSDAAILLHPEHIHASIRPSNVNKQFFEGPMPKSQGDYPGLLRFNLGAITEQQSVQPRA
jgi:hypothetical protein